MMTVEVKAGEQEARLKEEREQKISRKMIHCRLDPFLACLLDRIDPELVSYSLYQVEMELGS